MQNRTYRSMLLKVLLVGSFGLITISYAYGLERIRWKVQHTGLPGQLKGIERFAQNIKIEPLIIEIVQVSKQGIKLVRVKKNILGISLWSS